MNMFTRLSKSSRFTSLLRDWQILRQDVPKGFEKYFPGGKKPSPKGSQSKPSSKGTQYTRVLALVIFSTKLYIDSTVLTDLDERYENWHPRCLSKWNKIFAI